MHHCFTKVLATMTAAAIILLPTAPVFGADRDDFKTSTPIKHLVVIFQENVSFDHYFGTYPHAQKNKDGSQYFKGPKEDTPRANTLEAAGLLTNNPNGVNRFESTESTR
jgi:phospholipase C